MNRLTSAFILFCVFITGINAQNLLTGKVKSSTNDPLEGANVILTGTVLGTTTNPDGVFEFEGLRRGEYTLRISFIGYETVEHNVTVTGNTEVEIVLNETPFDIDAVVVTGTRTEKPLKNTPVLTELITKRQLEDYASTTVEDALEYVLPGFEFNRDAHGANMQFQGLGNEYVLFLIDGERLAGETRGNIDFSRLNTNDIERIEVIKGSSSSLYGSNAIGGVVNIITKKATKPLELQLSSKISDNNERNYNGIVGINQGIFSSKTTVAYKSSDGYDLSPETSPTVKTQERFKDNTVTQTFEITPNENLKLAANGSYYVYERFDDEATLPLHPLNKAFTLGGEVNYLFSHTDELSASYNIDQYEKYEVLERKNGETRMTNNHRFQTGRLVSKNRLPYNQSIVTGLEYNVEDLFSDRIENENQNVNDLVLFAQDEIKINNDITTIAGFRLNKHSDYGTHFTPQVSFMYQMLPFNFRLNYSQGFRAPSLKELYLNFDHFGMFFVLGNPDLKPETSQYMAGSVEYITKHFIGSLTIYRNNLDNMIATITDPDAPNIETYQNFAEVTTQGFELLFKTDLGHGFTFNTGYNFLDAEDVTTGLQLYGTARHSGTAQLQYKLLTTRYEMRINLSGKFVGPKVYESVINTDTGEVERIERAGYALWRLTSSHKVYDYLKVTLGVDNVFDYTDKQYLTTLSPGRRFFLVVDFNISSNIFN